MNSLKILVQGPSAILSFLILLSGMAACTPTPTRYETLAERPVQSTPPSTRVYFYPDKGQPPSQQDFDRYQCYLWAVKQTGFNPSAPYLAPHQKTKLVAHPPAGRDTVVGTAAGAIIGAAVSPPGKTAAGAVIGAAAGAAVGAASDAARRAEIERLESYYARISARQRTELEEKAADYRRAMAVCLEGRGYTVQTAE